MPGPVRFKFRCTAFKVAGELVRLSAEEREQLQMA
jgi:hypothetical protein